MTATLAVIPARLASTRLPEKPLARIAGRPMVVHVAERARAARGVDGVVVATDSEKILKAVKAAGFEAVLTAESHRNGTERIAEVAGMDSYARFGMFVNVQGDEPLVDPAAIEACVSAAHADGADIGTVAAPCENDADFTNANVVKVVVDRKGFALYFSRAPIPHRREGGTAEPPRRHVGLYAYRRDALLALARAEATPLERCEVLEQLRALERGMRIKVADVARAQPGVDTAEDLEKVRSILEAKS
ncbi:MAG TPA: 3-deoxy-manno-octulosonate cytidylyltransferase [bacterium]|nr:3-deoxy-manno-octulosonate cytidylyltransferase [bacterium]